MPACELTKKISNILVLYQILLIFAQKYIEMKIKEIQYISPDLFAPKDAWDKLSMAEKSEMMKVAVRNGITNLQEIRKKYNEFAGGGDKETHKPVTTGGAGYIPPAVDASWVANKLRNRLYRTINPLTDYNIRKNLAEVVSGNTMDYGDIHKDKEGNAYVDFEDATAPVEIVDDIWAKYLSIPENQRRFTTRIEESAYRPQMGGNENLSYYRLPLTDYEKDRLIEETDSLPIGKNKVTDIFSGYNLADHTIGRGIDAKGEYRSYYDRWDINPFSGKYQGWNIPFLRNLPDTTIGIGKPVEIYDRIYLDDYYGVPEPTHATYLPEVTVFSRKHKTPFEEMMEEMGRKAEGGKIHIKPSHRGRLTELKKRTGKTEAELYRTGSPATRKMITFARNARKWKHGDGGYINLFGEGGKGNPMNYEYRGTIYDDDLKRQGITHIAELPEVTITGRDLRKPYFSAFDGSAEPYIELFGALSKGLQPLSISQHVGAAFDAAQGERNYFESLFNGNSGFFTDKYATEHPWVSTFGNMAGDIATPLLLSKAPAAYRSGIRFMQNVDDRYQGMKDAAEYAASKSIKGNSASDITNYIWIQRQGDIASNRTMLPTKTRGSGLRDITGEGYHQTTSEGGNQTINVHLGGRHTGDKPWELNAMEPSRIKWLNEYLQTAPQGTIFGETGNTMNFAEQYTGINPSRWKAFKDALFNKTQTNPYWTEFEQNAIEKIENATEPSVKAYYKHLLDNNNPLSVDSYKMILDMAKKGRYDLRYDSAPMGLFNSQGVRQRDFYNSLLDMSINEQVDAINSWLKGINPKARPAYLQNGEVMIPRPLLFKKTPSANSWLRSTKK